VTPTYIGNVYEVKVPTSLMHSSGNAFVAEAGDLLIAVDEIIGFHSMLVLIHPRGGLVKAYFAGAVFENSWGPWFKRVC
jgi:hypothetical protein